MATYSDLYCSRADVNRWRTSGDIVGTSRLVAEVSAASNTITLDGHGLETGDEITVRAIQGSTLPLPLDEDATYFAIRLTNSKFQLSEADGGSPIDLTTHGGEMVLMKEPPYDAVIEKWSRWADSFLPAHVVPLGRTEPVHPMVRSFVAQLAANELFNLEGKRSETAESMKLDAVKVFERIGAGLTLRGAPASKPANLAVSSVVSTGKDPRGWGSRYLP